MGKNLIQQARGKGSPTYRAPSFRYRGEAKHRHTEKSMNGKITDIIHCQGHSAPLTEIQWEDGEMTLEISPEGIRVGEQVSMGAETRLQTGNVLALKSIPEGTSIFNIEQNPGDGGKFARSSGTFAKVLQKFSDSVLVMLPSKKKKTFHPDCRATIGIVAGGGRKEKPFLKAGFKHHKMRARNKLYPKVCGVSMNAVDHPFGGKCSSHKGRPTIAPHNAPPGKNVGKIRPRRTGMKR
ncbi:50S ribosomal protein L2 [Candidatus Woesearchaeota archaeon]|nr:50S ribosomal protein L2 [Candidatus Woesearchaeota archaeon]